LGKITLVLIQNLSEILRGETAKRKVKSVSPQILFTQSLLITNNSQSIITDFILHYYSNQEHQ